MLLWPHENTTATTAKRDTAVRRAYDQAESHECSTWSVGSVNCAGDGTVRMEQLLGGSTVKFAKMWADTEDEMARGMGGTGGGEIP